MLFLFIYLFIYFVIQEIDFNQNAQSRAIQILAAPGDYFLCVQEASEIRRVIGAPDFIL